jgi:hypothetical protein
VLHSLIERIWIEENVPMEWKTNIIVPIYKNNGNNYRVTIIEEYHYYAQVIKYYLQFSTIDLKIYRSYNW